MRHIAYLPSKIYKLTGKNYKEELRTGMKNKFTKYVILLLLIGIMISIFIFSSHTGTQSSGLSIKVTRFISRIIFRNFGSMSLSEQQFIVTEFHFFVRKLAHFTIYAALGALMYSFMETTDIKLKKKLPAAWALCICYAAADEFHQSFTPGRSMQLRDVIIDSAGALCGIFAAIIIFALIAYIKNEAEQERPDGGSSQNT